MILFDIFKGLYHMFSLVSQSVPINLLPREIEEAPQGISKIWSAVAAFFSDLFEWLATPPGIGVISFLGCTGLGIFLLAIADSEGMEGPSLKLGRILLKIASIAAFILGGALLASGIIFGIV